MKKYKNIGKYWKIVIGLLLILGGTSISIGKIESESPYQPVQPVDMQIYLPNPGAPVVDGHS